MLHRPVQPGGPPFLLGGTSPVALRRAGRIADGWVASSRTDLAKISEGVEIVRQAAAAEGRDPSALRIICRGVIRWDEPSTDASGHRRLPSGGPAPIREGAARLAGQGGTQLLSDLHWDPPIGAPDPN